MNLSEIQNSLKEAGIDGWLFFDHHGRDPIAYWVLGLPEGRMTTRRWYYLVPCEGEPRGLVHRIEPGVLEGLPGQKALYSSWIEQIDGLRQLLGTARRVAMQYSPQCAIPYVSNVDAGTVELVRAQGAEVVSSVDLVQLFEARWSPRSLELHLDAGRRVDKVRAEAFELIRARTRGGECPTEFEVQQFIGRRFAELGLVVDHPPVVAVNANASDPHYSPQAASSAVVRHGDLVLIDMWAKMDDPEAVYYDITWMAFCGDNPPDELARVFSVVRDARDAGIRLVTESVAAGRPLRGFEVDDAVRGCIADHGFGRFFTHRTGHSIGRSVHGNGANMDNLETHDERMIIPWTAFSIEPGVYLPGFGVRSEVNVFIGEGKALVTGEIQHELLLL